MINLYNNIKEHYKEGGVIGRSLPLPQKNTLVNQVENYPKIEIAISPESLTKYKKLFISLDDDLQQKGKEILLEMEQGIFPITKLKYMETFSSDSYSATGINEEILRVILPFNNFAGLKGIDFGFGNGEILKCLNVMKSSTIGLDDNILAVQHIRNSGIEAYMIRCDCEIKQFQQISDSLLYPCDFVISTLVLDRVSKPKNFLANFFMPLKKGGRFALQTLLPIVAIDDDITDVSIIYTSQADMLFDGRDVEQDKLNLIRRLLELGATDIVVYQIPYRVKIKNNVHIYNVWSFCGQR